MTKKLTIHIIIFICLLIPSFVFSQDTFEPLVEIPNVLPETGTSLNNFLPNLFTFIIGLAGILSVVMITYGGFKYATTDAWQGKSEGKEIIKNAFIGLAITLGAWIILNTINPNLLNLELLIEPIEVTCTGDNCSGTPSGDQNEDDDQEEEDDEDEEEELTCNPDIEPGTPTTPPELPPCEDEPLGAYLTHAQAKELLGSNFSISSSGNCSDRTNKRCTSLDTIPKSAIDSLKRIQEKCGCRITITGGTEVGHKSHGAQLPIVDLGDTTQLLRAIPEAGYRLDANFGEGATCEGSPGKAIPCSRGVGSIHHIHMEL